jgi:hypothetical protein
VARPKHHHYVTKAYLEGFLGPSQRHLVCYGRGRGPFRRSPEDLACQRNYYALKKEDGTWDDSIETLIGQTVEGPGLPVIQKLASGNTKLSWQDRNRISLLIAFQEMRTPSARERTRAFSRALNERVTHDIKTVDPHQNSVQIMGESGKTSTVTLDEMTKAHDEICDDHSTEIHRPLVGTALKLSDLLRYMKFTVYYPTGNEEFVTTDTPVIRVFRKPAPLGTGINRTDVEVRFPLSRKALLTLTHDLKLVELLERASDSKRSRLLKALPEIRIKPTVDSQVAALNRAHARHSHRWLFASNELDWAPAVLSEASAAPGILDLSSHNFIHFQSTVNYDPKMDSGAE